MKFIACILAICLGIAIALAEEGLTWSDIEKLKSNRGQTSKLMRLFADDS